MWPQEDKDNFVDNWTRNNYNDPEFSDLIIRLKDGTTINAHRYVLAFRSKVWHSQIKASTTTTTTSTTLRSSSSSSSLTTKSPPSSPSNQTNINNNTISSPLESTANSVTQSTTTNHQSSLSKQQQSSNASSSSSSSLILELDFTGLDVEVATSILTWVYTGEFEFDSIFHDDQYIFGVMKAARKFKLTSLFNQCEKCLLAIAPEVGLDRVARLLMEEQGNMNVTDDKGYTLLHLTIMKGDEKGAIYLLNNNADVGMLTPERETPLELAIRKRLPQVVRLICQKDYDMKNYRCSKGDPPIWLALKNRDENIASILVEFNCDTNCWEENIETKCSQNLLHRALESIEHQEIACFLIRSGCDCNSPRRPLANGEGDDVAFDGQTPLHIACAWGMLKVVETLLEFHADINAQDSDEQTPLHVAIINQHEAITKLLIAQQQLDLKLRDKYGQNAFALAMSTKNNKAASIILSREPHAAEKYDPKGRTFLHNAILKNDIESVLFLLSVHVNIHSRVQDSSKYTPLHLAVQVGDEMILRNLLLAGANINDVTVQNQTALHIAAANNHPHLCTILLENNINFDAIDSDLNNALHLACQNGNLNVCKVLLTESNINAEALNLRGQNPVHLIAQHCKENAPAILDLFMECMPEYKINTQDGEGNTALILAYKNGNANLCRALIRYSACLGVSNKSGVNIFNAQVASKNLLYRLLDYLPQEPPWADGDCCSECQSKFGMTNRKHHCRHCGRVLCAKCSPKLLVIKKFQSTKQERLCGMCYEVLTYGSHPG